MFKYLCVNLNGDLEIWTEYQSFIKLVDKFWIRNPSKWSREGVRFIGDSYGPVEIIGQVSSQDFVRRFSKSNSKTKPKTIGLQYFDFNTSGPTANDREIIDRWDE